MLDKPGTTYWLVSICNLFRGTWLDLNQLPSDYESDALPNELHVCKSVSQTYWVGVSLLLFACCHCTIPPHCRGKRDSNPHFGLHRTCKQTSQPKFFSAGVDPQRYALKACKRTSQRKPKLNLSTLPQLSDARKLFLALQNGGGGESRTPGLTIRSRPLYPSELRPHVDSAFPASGRILTATILARRVNAVRCMCVPVERLPRKKLMTGTALNLAASQFLSSAFPNVSLDVLSPRLCSMATETSYAAFL